MKTIFADVPESLGQITTAVDELARRGVPLGKTFDELAKQQLALSHITGTDLATNVEQTTGLFKKFGVSLREQPALMDELFKATQKSGKALGDILGPLVSSGTSLQAFGFSLQESIALIGNLSASGVDAGRTLTTLRIAFGRIAKTGGDPVKVFADLRKEFTDGTPKAKAMQDAIKILGTRGQELAIAMAKGKFNFDAFLKSISDGKGGIIATEEATRTLGEKISVMAHQFILAVQPLASSFTRGISQGLTDLSGPMTTLAVGAGHLLQALSPLAAVFGGVLVGAFRLILPLITAFGQGIDTIASALDLIPPPLFIALAGALGIATIGFEGFGTAIISVGVAIDIATGPIGLMLIGITALGAVMSRFGKGVQQTKIDTSGLEDVFTVAKDSADTLTDSMKGARAEVEKWLKTQLALKAGGVSGVDTINDLGLSFDATAKALTGTDAQFNAFQTNMTNAATATGITGKAYDAFHDTLLAGRDQLEINAAATVAAAEASGLLSEKQVKAAQAAARNKGFNDDYGKSIIDNVAVLNQLTPAIERATAAQNAAAEKKAAPAFADLAGQFAQGTLSAKGLTDQLLGMGFTAEGAKTKVDGLKAQVQAFGAAVDKAFPSVSEAAKGLKNDLTGIAADVHDRQQFLVLQFAALKAGGSSNMDGLRAAIASNINGINADTHKLATNTDLTTFTNNLKTQATNISTFFTSLHTLVKEGFGAIARDLLDLGAQQGGTIAAGLASDKNKAAAANAASKNLASVKEAARKQANADFPQYEGIGKSIGDATARGIGKADIAAGIRGQSGQIKAALKFVASTAAGTRFEFTKPAIEGVHAAAAAVREDHSIENAARQKANNAARFFAQGGFDLSAPIKQGLNTAGKTVANDRQVASAAGTIGKTATNAFGNSLDLKGKAQAGMRAAAGAVSASRDATGAAAGAGAATGQAFVSGLVGGLSGSGAIGQVRAAAGKLAQTAKDSANAKLGIKSPSTVGITIGRQFAQGIAIGVLNGQTVVNASVDKVATGITAQAQGIAAGINNLGDAGPTITRLRDFLAQLATTATSTAGSLSTAQEALQSFLSTANSALPTASGALSAFVSTQASAQSTFDSALAGFHDSSKLAAADAQKLQTQTDKTADAFRKAAFIKTNFLDVAIAAILPTDTIAKVQAAYDSAVETFRRAAAGLTSITQALKDQRSAVHDAAKALAEASTALKAANDPQAFIDNLNKQTRHAQAFTADIRKLVTEGFVDLAKKLAEQGEEAAGKLADSFAKDKHKAKLANNAVKSAQTYADKFTKELNKLFGGDDATKAGAVAGSKVGAGAADAATQTFEDSIKVLVEKLQLVKLRPALAINTKPAEAALVDAAKSLSFVPEVGTLADQIHAAVATMPDTPVALLPLLAAVPPLAPLDLPVIPKVGPISVPDATVTVRIPPIPPLAPIEQPVIPHLIERIVLPALTLSVKVPPLPLFDPIDLPIRPRLTDRVALPPLTLTLKLPPIPPFPAVELPVVPHVVGEITLPDQTINVHGVLDAIEVPPTTVDVSPNLIGELAPFGTQTVEVEPHLLPLPTLEPISVDVVPKFAGAAASAAATAQVAASPQPATSTLDLDLTIVLADGQVVRAQKVIPLPKTGSLSQRVKTQIQASS